MTVSQIRNAFGVVNKQDEITILELGTMCTDTVQEYKENKLQAIGEPTEVAITNAAIQIGLNKTELYEKMQRINDIPFDSKRKMMTTIHKFGNKYRIITKGAPDILLKKCSKYYQNGDITPIFSKIENIKEQNKIMADKALRVIAVAYKDVESLPTKLNAQTIEEDLTFVGLIGMFDPPREGVKEAVRTCRRAGIKTVMIQRLSGRLLLRSISCHGFMFTIQRTVRFSATMLFRVSLLRL